MSDRSDRRNPERLARQSDAIETADRLSRLFDDPAVQDWFNNAERKLIDSMISKPTQDDEGRRAAALEIQALRALRSSISIKIKAGQMAASTINQEFSA